MFVTLLVPFSHVPPSKFVHFQNSPLISDPLSNLGFHTRLQDFISLKNGTILVRKYFSGTYFPKTQVYLVPPP